MKVYCNTCAEEFDIKLKQQKRGVNTVINYFSCPHCKEKYLSTVETGETRRMQRQIKELYNSKVKLGRMIISNEEYSERLWRIDKEITKMKVELENVFDKLKDEITL